MFLIYILRTHTHTSSVVEPFHFGPAPAPASQDGGSGSSSSPVVHNLLLKKSLEKFHFSIYRLVLFTEMYECFALLLQYFTYSKGTD